MFERESILDNCHESVTAELSRTPEELRWRLENAVVVVPDLGSGSKLGIRRLAGAEAAPPRLASRRGVSEVTASGDTAR
jgi:hypothetical protein